MCVPLQRPVLVEARLVWEVGASLFTNLEFKISAMVCIDSNLKIDDLALLICRLRLTWFSEEITFGCAAFCFWLEGVSTDARNAPKRRVMIMITATCDA